MKSRHPHLPSDELTPRQAEVLKVVKCFFKKHGQPPNYPELSRLLKINKSAVHGHIQNLALKGYLRHLPRQPNRSIQLVESH